MRIHEPLIQASTITNLTNIRLSQSSQAQKRIYYMNPICVKFKNRKTNLRNYNSEWWLSFGVVKTGRRQEPSY